METKNPKCNHCDYEFDDEELWYGEHTVGKVHTGDCDTSELKCPSCSKSFHVRCIHRISFDQIDEDGDEI